MSWKWEYSMHYSIVYVNAMITEGNKIEINDIVPKLRLECKMTDFVKI